MNAPSRNPQRRVGAATRWLIRAFAPGCPTMLRSWASQRVRVQGERLDRLTIFFDLPDDAAFERALELEGSASALRLVRIGRKVVRELTAAVSGPQRTLTVEALLVSDDWGSEAQ